MRLSAFEILGVYADSTAEEIKAAWKAKILDCRSGKVSETTEVSFNSAYNEIKTEDRRAAYLKKNPWAKHEKKPAATKTSQKFGVYGEKLDDRGVPLDLHFVTPKDRRNFERG